MKIKKLTFALLALYISTGGTWKASAEGEKVPISSVQQKKNSISGIIKDANGQPIIGASIYVKSAPSVGAATNIEGRFTLNNIPDKATLVATFVGMKTKEVTLHGEAYVEIILESDAISMEEVVVVGFGAQKKVNLTGSVATVDKKALETRPVQNVAQALQGIVPGLNITQGEGTLDTRPNINIRGVATIGSGSSGVPLILIDGTEGDLNAINPQDIENISILKDAGSAAVYGSRAPFGVILVTTKKGKAGKTTINYNNSFKFSSPVILPHMMDSYTFALYFNEASKNSGSGAYFSDEWLQRIKDFQAGKLINPANGRPMTTVPKGNIWSDYNGGNDNIDWYKEVYKKVASSQEHNVSVNGGNEKTTYYISGNFLDQNGLIKYGGDFFNRYALTGKINTQITKAISLGYNTRWIREDYSRPSSLTNSLNGNLARQGWPILPLYDPNGFIFSSPSPVLDLRDGGRDKKQTDWLYQQLQLIVEPLKGWKITAEMNYKTVTTFRHWDNQRTYNHNVQGNPYVYNSYSAVHEEASKNSYLNPNIFSSYSKSLNNHNFMVMAGFQSEKYKDRDLSAERNGIINANLPTLNTTDGTDASGKIVAPNISGGYGNWATTGFFGRFNYDYNGKYLAEINYRYDGTSRFLQNKRWNYFPSASVGWNISKESFWQPIEQIVNNLKLRASYGVLGNQNTYNNKNYRLAFYPAIQTMPIGTANGTWLVNGLKPNTASAPDVVSSTQTWEKVRTWDAGVDLGMFNGKLTGTFDYFVRYTNDMLGPGVELPAIFGTEVPKTNNTDLKTSGFELSLSWQDRPITDFGYGIKVTLADSRTIITKYPNPTGRLDQNISGRYYGEIWGLKTIGIAKSPEEMQAHLAKLPNGGQNAIGNNWNAGDIMYTDINNDGKIDKGSNTIGDHGDLCVVGNNTPRFPFSVDLTADWKGFDFRAFFQGIMKRDYYQNSYFFWGAWKGGIWWSTGFNEHLDYYRGDASNPLGQNIDSYYPRPLFGDGKNMEAQTRYVQNAAYVRLKNLQLGYSIPGNLCKKLKIQKLRLFLSGENLWTYTKMAKMFDPETIDKGYGGNVYPIQKVYSCGLNLTF